MSRAEIKGRMSMDAKGVKVGVDSAKKSVSGFTKNLGSLKTAMAGAFSIGAVTAFGRAVSGFGSDMSDAAFQAELSTDAFQAFLQTAKDGGADLKQVTNGLISLRDAQMAAVQGEQMYQDAFESLGITIDQVAQSSIQDLLEQVAVASAETGNFGAVVDIFGKRNAAKLEEALNVLAQQTFPGLIDSMREAGRIMDEDLIARLDIADDKISALTDRFKIFGAEVISVFERAFIRIGAFVHSINQSRIAVNGVREDGGSWSAMNEAAETTRKEAYDAYIGTYIKEQETRTQKYAEQREKREARNYQTRKNAIREIYAEEEALQKKAILKSIGKQPAGAFEAADSMARIGGKIGGQMPNLESSTAKMIRFLEQIEKNTTPNTTGKTLTVVGN